MNLEAMKKNCFFCGEEIEGKKTMEHIIPNGLLKKLNIKEAVLYGNLDAQYSRVKVPAHPQCNNNFGSQYEEKLMEILSDPDKIYETITNSDEVKISYGPKNTDIALLRTWLTKIYYGLFYNDFLKTSDEEHRAICREILSAKDFQLTRQSYKNLYGFNVPSSLYIFKTNNIEFDLRTIIVPTTIMLRINGLIFILCIGDGFLCKQYLSEETLEGLKSYIEINENHNSDFPTPEVILAEIIALRNNIPKTPSFYFTENKMFNMSLFTGLKDPHSAYKVDEERITIERDEILKEFGVILKEI